jgi:hypothetical protein
MQTQRGSGAKKKAAAAVAVLLVLLIALGGTYMWFDYSQHKTNEASNRMNRYDVRLVEDFEEVTEWKTIDPAQKKEVRAANMGRASEGFSGVFVRLQLKEYMEINPLTYTQTTMRYAVGTDGRFVSYKEAGDTGAAGDAGRTKALEDWPGHTVTWLTDAATGDEGWFVQTRADDPNGQYGKFVVTEISLDAAATPLVVNAVRAEHDASGLHQQKPNGECDYEVHRWNGEPDGSSYDGTEMFPGLTGADSLTFADFVKWALGEDVMSLSDFIDPAGNNGQPVAKWIYDDRSTADGGTNWVYWGRMLEPQNDTNDNPSSTTSNLLESIKLDLQPQGEFYYAIHVEMEALSPDELVGGNARWTDAPEEIVASLTQTTPSIQLARLKSSVEINTTVPQAELVTVVKSPAGAAVTWTSSDDTIAAVNADGDVTGLKKGTVTITATLSGGDSASYTLNITDSASAASFLQEKIDEAKDILGWPRDMGDDHSGMGDGEGNPYTPGSLDGLQQAVEDAEDLLNRVPPATDEELEAAEQAIQDAIDGLENKEDQSGLGALLDIAEDLEENDYTTSTWEDFEDAYNDAQAVYNNPGSTAQEIQEALDALHDAIYGQDDTLDNGDGGLATRGDASGLEDFITEALGKTPQNNYTTSTWTALQNALDDSGRTVPVDVSDLMQAKIDALETALQTALTNLVDLSGLLEAIADAGLLDEDDYIPATWTALEQAMADAADEAIPANNATQSAVDAAEQAIREAMAGLQNKEDRTGLGESLDIADDLDENDYTASTWEDFMDAYNDAQTAYNDPGATAQEIIEAMDALHDAIYGQDDTLDNGDGGLAARGDASGLEDLITEALGKTPQNSYTASTWNALQDALDDSGRTVPVDVSDLTQAEIDALETALQTALTNLVDLAGLLEAIADANVLDEEDYTSGTWSALEQALADAADEAIPANNATQSAVDAAETAIRQAISDLDTRADHSGLGALLDIADDLGENDYTTSTWEDFVNAYNDAQTVYNDSNATAQEILEALDALHDAIYGQDDILDNGDGGLATRGDATSLEDLITEALTKTPQNNYTASTWNVLQDALDDTGRTVPVDASDLTQAEIDALETVLQTALTNLVDLSGLLDAIADAGLLNEGNYTPATWSALEQTLADAADEALPANNATQSAVDAAETAIRQAISDLDARADQSGLATLLSVVNGLDEDDYTTSTWGSFEVALDNANGVYTDPNATQADVNAALTALQDAKDDLELRANTASLNALIAQATGLTANNYTAASWNGLQDALDDTGRTTPVDNSDMSQDEADALTAALQNALNALVDLRGLLDAIADAGLLDEGNYTPATWNALQAAVNNAADEANRSNASTQTQVNSAEQSIRTAISSLVPVSDKAALAAALTGHPLNQNLYTTSTWASSGYTAAYNAANGMLTLLNDGNPANDPEPLAIQNAIDGLNAAIAFLELRGDPTAINNYANNTVKPVTAAGGYAAKYTADSRSALGTALTNAGNGNLDVSDLNAAQVAGLYTALQDAYASLVDLTGLMQAISAASVLEETDYTTASWEAVMDALEDAADTAADGSATQQQVNDAASALNNAVGNLVFRPVVTLVKITPTTAGPFNIGGAIIEVNFGATVTGQHLISGTGSSTSKGEDGVTWSISATDSGLSFNTANGLLSGTPTKTGNYTVTATSIDDPNESDSVTFTVQVPAPGSGVAVGEAFTHNDVTWRVLYDDGNGNKLIITDNIVGVSKYNNGGSYGAYTGSDLKTAMDYWWSTTYNAPELKAIALYPSNFNVEESFNPSGNYMIENAINGPGASASGQNNGVVFPLSISEANTYRSMFEGGHLMATGSGMPSHWWLRSPGQSSYAGAHVNATGAFAGIEVTSNSGLRPAVWIHP